MRWHLISIGWTCRMRKSNVDRLANATSLDFLFWAAADGQFYYGSTVSQGQLPFLLAAGSKGVVAFHVARLWTGILVNALLGLRLQARVFG